MKALNISRTRNVSPLREQRALRIVADPLDPTQRQYVRVVHPDEEPTLFHRYGVSWADTFAVTFGVIVTFVISGYQFGRSNHTVYLLDVLHKMNPRQLGQDWFTTETFQYHALFGLLTRAVWRFLEPSFFFMYLGLTVLLHVAWFRITRRLGGGRFAYMISVALLYVSGAGTSLGGYGFLQDSALLPSNISAVALLWAILFWMLGRPGAAGLAMAVAAAFHLNYAVVVPVLWLLMFAFDGWDYKQNRVEPVPRPWFFTQWISGKRLVGAIFALGASAISIALALRAMPKGLPPMPLKDFLDLYVHLRHPHHYDPRTWPTIMWVMTSWAMLPAIWMMWRVHRPLVATSPVRQAYRRATRVLVLFLLILGFAGAVAGYTFINERFVQMSLYRFSIFPHLLATVMTAIWLAELKPLRGFTKPLVAIALPGAMAYFVYRFVDGNQLRIEDPFLSQANAGVLMILAGLFCGPLLVLIIDRLFTHREALYASATLALISLTALFGSPQRFGLMVPPENPSMDELANWARNPQRTGMDALFLMPPDDEMFRLQARRAIVVNFKGVPQLSTELPAWRDRLSHVLHLPNLDSLPRGSMVRTLEAIGERYDELSADQLVQAADRYGARYVVTRHTIPDASQAGLTAIYNTVDLAYFVYDRMPTAPVTATTRPGGLR